MEVGPLASILVVEDHPVFVQSVVRLLRDHGHYEVATAGTAEQAVERLQELDFDLALIDISLPGRSGITLVKTFRDLKRGLPCLMLSGLDSQAYVQESMAAGASGYVLKDDVPGILEGIRVALRGGVFISDALKPSGRAP